MITMNNKMDDFILAMQIFNQHLSGPFALAPAKDRTLEVCGVHPDHLAQHEKDRLYGLGFVVDTEEGYARFLTSLYAGC